MCIDKLDEIANKYINTNQSTIKIKPVDVKPSTYIDSSKKINNKDPKFKVLNWSEEVFVIKKVKNTVLWTYFIGDLKGEEIFRIFYGKNGRKQIIKSLELKKS